MESKTPLAKKLIIAFGAVLFAVLLGVFIWSLTQPAVTEGPMPGPWKGARDAASDG